MQTPTPSKAKTPWRYRLNPCDIDRSRVLAPLGDALALIWRAFTTKTDCPCCLGLRLVAAVSLSYLAGLLT